MGKRELVIVLAFLVVGAVAYQLTAPPPKAGERAFSLSRIFSGIRQQVRSNAASAEISSSGVVLLRPGITELRLTAIRAMPLTITGERRSDIGYELWVESDGPDEATARDWAGRAKVVDDDLGRAQSIGVWFPEEGRQTGRLTLRVPDQMLVRLEGSGRVNVSGVRAVDLRGLTGDAKVSGVAGPLTGTHRSGELAVSDVGSVKLELVSSRASLTGIGGPIAVGGRSGECTVSKSRGELEAAMTNAELTITEHAGPVRVGGEGGTAQVTLPAKDLIVDVKRMLVEVTLAAATPATILTTDEPLRVTLVGPPALSLDAVAAEGGEIRAADLGLEATRQDREARLEAPLGGGGPRLVLRNRRADIVISLRK